MKLTDLEPQFKRIASSGHYENVATPAEAQGIRFLCPKCFVKNGGNVGTHLILIWFRDRSVPADALPGPGRWIATGTGYADLTMSPSINLENPDHVGCQWHGFVTNGEVE
jgi:hypothetical protein